MKTRFKPISGIFVLLVIMLSSVALSAQNTQNYYSVEGVVKDRKTKKKLENVNISVPGTNIGTVTNEDGEFSVKIPESSTASFIQFSHLGYTNQKLMIDKNNLHEQAILLSTNSNLLTEIIVDPTDPLKLVQNAILKIESNYTSKSNLLTGFYRETVKKKRNYINISEAVIDIYKTDYKNNVDEDRTSIYKGRKLISPKPNDTLIVKFQGGPNLPIYVDLVKNKSNLILNTDDLSFYRFKMEESVMIDDRAHYVVSFEPQVIAAVPLYSGKLYIDVQSLAFSRAEFSLSMDNEQIATQLILRRKPFNLRFKPEEVSYLVTYKQKDGISYLNYVRNEIRFKCDWKKRLFSTNYTIVSEMVVTGIKDRDVNKISYKESFKSNQVLSEKVSNFSDANFWGDYNIIEPSESLESAVTKLKKQYKEE